MWWRRAVDVLFRRTAAAKRAEVNQLFAENIEASARIVAASKVIQVASEESNERLKEIRTEIEESTAVARSARSGPRTGDVLQLARNALDRVQKH